MEEGCAQLSVIAFDTQERCIGKLTRPDKVYLENPNLLYALCPSKVEIGTARETFAITHLSYGHNVEYGKESGDFKVDSRYHFEIGGGKDKGFRHVQFVIHIILKTSALYANAGNGKVTEIPEREAPYSQSGCVLSNYYIQLGIASRTSPEMYQPLSAIHLWL